jgi:ATP/maltotriose-dependent transcriptional regulator MalT
VAAGACGVIRAVEHDLVTVVAKTLLLLLLPVGPHSTPIIGADAQSADFAGWARNNSSTGSRAVPQSDLELEASPSATEVAELPNIPAQFNDPPIDRVVAGRLMSLVGNAAEVSVITPAPTGRRLTLTERELQVLRGMADGKSNAEIGRELFVSEDTVKTHARRLLRKLGARDGAHAVASGFRAGLLT